MSAKLHYTDESVTLWHGNCIEVMRDIDDASVDAIEREADYLPLIVQRISKPLQVALDFGEAVI